MDCGVPTYSYRKFVKFPAFFLGFNNLCRQRVYCVENDNQWMVDTGFTVIPLHLLIGHLKLPAAHVVAYGQSHPQ